MRVDKDTDNETSELPSIGTSIRLAREAKKLSQKELAGKLNLDLQLITNIENDQFDALPAPAFVRGYIRACAKLLDQDSKQWINIYLLTTRSDDPKPAPLKNFNLKKTDSSHPFFRSITIIVIVILMALAFYWWFTEKGGSSLFYVGTETSTPTQPSIVALPQTATGPAKEAPTTPEQTRPKIPLSVTKPEEVPAPEQTDQQSVLTAAEETITHTHLSKKTDTNANENESITNKQNPEVSTKEAIASVTAVEPQDASPTEKKGTDTDIETTSKPAPEISPGQTTALPAVAATPADQSSPSSGKTKTLTPEQGEITGDDNLVLKTSSKSWVEVYDDNGHRLMFDMQTNANERQLRGQAPFRIFLGDATGMTITINGHDIGEISHHKTTKTARFYIDSDGTIRK